MNNRFIVNFKVAEDQTIDNGSIVTYVEENRLATIKENLTFKTDFFVVVGMESLDVSITNGIDSIRSTQDQLLRVEAFLEELPTINKPNLSENVNRYMRDLLNWGYQEEIRRVYEIRDNYLSIIASGLVITENDFYLESIMINGSKYDKKLYASLIPDRISTYIEG